MDELHARLLPSYFRRAPGPSKSVTEVERILASADELLTVAEEAGALVGLVHVLLYDAPPVPAMTPCRRAHVDSLVVRSDRRRARVASRLMQAAEEWAGRRGASEIVLTVWAGNRAAEAFYGGRGFRAVNQVLGKPL
jgi:ribosomal protein S18 acetylase RimI-like enzyme